MIVHLGMPEYREFLDLADRHPRVHLDTTMAFTDFPNIPYPYLHRLRALERLDLGPAWPRAVCHDNAARLFGL